jgi:hypothetical protein
MKITKLLIPAIALAAFQTSRAQDITLAEDDAYSMAIHYSARGYNPFPVTNGVDGSGAKKEFTLTVQKGIDYVFLVGRDRYMQDLDLYVYDEAGALIMKDRRSTSRAGVRFRAMFDGNVRVIMHVARAQGLGAWSMLLCSRGGGAKAEPGAAGGAFGGGGGATDL